MSFSPDISQLFNAAFGFVPITYKVDDKSQQLGKATYSSIQVASKEEAARMSWMGTPIMFPMAFKGDTYRFYKSSADIEEKPLKDFDLPATAVADFRRAKNITKTNVLGNNGTVKEIYGFDDWQIRIRGLCLDTPTQKAFDIQSKLLQWEKVVDSVEVSGDLFLQKNIYRITIEEIDFKQPQGRHNVIPFEITASSDEPLELVL